jgi:glycosyltransferase involved in cell wall biosynthesis/GNAT superfamily N-acetyltransferase
MGYPADVAAEKMPDTSEVSFHVAIVEAYDRAFVNFRKDLTIALVALGWKVTAVAPEFSEDVAAHLEELGVGMRKAYFNRGSINPVEEARAIRRLGHLLADLNVDFTISFGPKPAIYTGLAPSPAKTSKIAVITGLGFGFIATDIKARLVRTAQIAMYRSAMARTSHVFFQNEDDRQLFEDLKIVSAGSPYVSVVNGSGVDLDAFSQSPVSKTSVPTFLFVGRLQSSKGFEDFARAAQIIKRSGVDARFRVVGWRDPENPQTVSELRLWQLINSGTIEYVGRSNDVRKELRDCSALVLPSLREGTPRSVLEALATGRAVVTTDVPGCRETIVDGWNGYKVPPSDPYAIASALLKYCTDPEKLRQHGNNGRRLAEMKFDVNQVNERLIAPLQARLRARSERDRMEASAPFAVTDYFARSEVPAIAQMHMDAFPDYFMTSLGKHFLVQFYLAFTEDPSSVVSVAREPGGRILGVAVGSAQPAGFFRRALVHRFTGFALAGLSAVLSNPGSVFRLVRGAMYRGDQPRGSGGALLSTIAVVPTYQGGGVGQAVLESWERNAVYKGATEAYLTTDSDKNVRVNHFYQKAGWSIDHQYKTREGRAMSRYRKSLPDAAQ